MELVAWSLVNSHYSLPAPRPTPAGLAHPSAPVGRGGGSAAHPDWRTALPISGVFSGSARLSTPPPTRPESSSVSGSRSCIFLCILQGPTLTSLPLGSPPGFPYYSKNEWLLPPPQLPRMMDPWALATLIPPNSGPFSPSRDKHWGARGRFCSSLWSRNQWLPRAPTDSAQSRMDDALAAWPPVGR